jgi:hypothetical protein
MQWKRASAPGQRSPFRSKHNACLLVHFVAAVIQHNVKMRDLR